MRSTARSTSTPTSSPATPARFSSAPTHLHRRGATRPCSKPCPRATTPPPRLEGTVAFLRTAGADHESFVTHAWVDDPIRDVLERLGGYARDPGKRAQARHGTAR